jgi:hypothetical protein
MTHIKKIMFVLIIILILYLLYDKNENYGGALTQLYAKGPQDIYLTGNDYIYYPYNPIYPLYGYDGYGIRRSPFIWNEPTRLKYNQAPYLLLTPDRYYLY